MSIFKKQLQRLQKLKRQSLVEEVFGFLEKLESDLVKLNQEQLQRGLDSNDNPLFSKKTGRGIYSKATEEISGGKKKEGDPYTLFDTGDFYEGFELFQRSKKETQLISKDPKYLQLVTDFGEAIQGVPKKELRNIVLEKVLPKLQQHIRSTLGI